MILDVPYDVVGSSDAVVPKGHNKLDGVEEDIVFIFILQYIYGLPESELRELDKSFTLKDLP